MPFLRQLQSSAIIEARCGCIERQRCMSEERCRGLSLGISKGNVNLCSELPDCSARRLRALTNRLVLPIIPALLLTTIHFPSTRSLAIARPECIVIHSSYVLRHGSGFA